MIVLIVQCFFQQLNPVCLYVDVNDVKLSLLVDNLEQKNVRMCRPYSLHRVNQLLSYQLEWVLDVLEDIIHN